MAQDNIFSEYGQFENFQRSIKSHILNNKFKKYIVGFLEPFV